MAKTVRLCGSLACVSGGLDRRRGLAHPAPRAQVASPSLTTASGAPGGGAGTFAFPLIRSLSLRESESRDAPPAVAAARQRFWPSIPLSPAWRPLPLRSLQWRLRSLRRTCSRCSGRKLVARRQAPRGPHPWGPLDTARPPWQENRRRPGRRLGASGLPGPHARTPERCQRRPSEPSLCPTGKSPRWRCQRLQLRRSRL